MRVRKWKIGNPETRGGFTLMEIMMVVAIIGLIMAMGIPSILSMRHEAPLRKAVNDVIEICSRARAQAILKNEITTVTFHPHTKDVETSADADKKMPSMRLGNAPVTSSQFDPSVDIAMLDINLMDFGDSDSGTVRFFPNGTCDELTLVLFSRGEYIKITLEPTTSLASAGSVR